MINEFGRFCKLLRTDKNSARAPAPPRENVSRGAKKSCRILSETKNANPTKGNLMLESLKKTIFAGVGATVMSADAVKTALADLVKKGKLSADDAKAAFDKAAARGEEDAKALYGKAAARGKETLENLGALAGTKRLENLEKRVAAIEGKLGVPAPAAETPETAPAPAENEPVPAAEEPKPADGNAA